MNRYEKLMISLRYWLLGRAESDPSYLKAVHALEFAAKFHTGKRKDEVTPEYQHQLEIAHYLRTLHVWLLHPAETIAAALLHDVCEDYDVSFAEIENKFGSLVAESVRLLTKKHRGVKVDTLVYFNGIAAHVIASIVKGADRINNLQSMLGVFSLEKQRKYCAEAREHFLPMLKVARRLFPEQEGAYENIKLVMMSQLALLEAAHAAAG